jgi:acyl carrier protein
MTAASSSPTPEQWIQDRFISLAEEMGKPGLFSHEDELNSPIASAGVDSLEFVEIVMELEEQYGIEIGDEQLHPSVTFSELFKIVAQAGSRSIEQA